MPVVKRSCGTADACDVTPHTEPSTSESAFEMLDLYWQRSLTNQTQQKLNPACFLGHRWGDSDETANKKDCSLPITTVMSKKEKKKEKKSIGRDEFAEWEVETVDVGLLLRWFLEAFNNISSIYFWQSAFVRTPIPGFYKILSWIVWGRGPGLWCPRHTTTFYRLHVPLWNRT